MSGDLADAGRWRDAYLFGFPIVECERVRALASRGDPRDPTGGALGQFIHRRRLITPAFDRVAAPNNDTLYSSAWLDLDRGPIRLHLPPTGDRYYSFMLMDLWTDVFAVIERRRNGNEGGEYLIVGPGTLPDPQPGVELIVSPANRIFVLGRFLIDGEADLAAVHALQDGCRLDSATTSSPADPPLIARDALEDERFFDHLGVALGANPPRPEDAAAVAQLESLRLGPHSGFCSAGLTDAVRECIRAGIREARAEMLARWHAVGIPVGGWNLCLGLGNYGTDYLLRAAAAWKAWAALPSSETVYLARLTDSHGQPLNGSEPYRLVFDPGALPPVDAFWSLTLYRAGSMRLADNPIRRYAIGDRTPGLVFGADGSLEIAIRPTEPAEGPSNWLPSPDEEFALILRLYAPRAEVFDGVWLPPRVQPLLSL